MTQDSKHGLLAQGDILLRPVHDYVASRRALLPYEQSDALVLAHGERSGHAHIVKSRGARLYRHPMAALGVPRELYIGHLVLTRAATLVHDEHAPIALTAGTVFVVTRQRELSARAEREATLVAD